MRSHHQGKIYFEGREVNGNLIYFAFCDFRSEMGSHQQIKSYLASCNQTDIYFTLNKISFHRNMTILLSASKEIGE